MLNIPIRAKIHNRFDIYLTDIRTKKSKQVGYAENIILDALWTKFFNANPNFFYAIHLGSGTGTLAKDRTGLFTFVVAKAATDFQVTQDAATGICSRRGQIYFNETEQIGVTFTEIGIASGTGSSTLMTHAQICDMNGNVVSIEKTGYDVLTVYATIYARFEGQTMHSGKTRIIGSASWLDNALCNWMLGSLTSLPSATAFFYEGPGGGLHANRGNSRGLASKSTTRTLDAANKKATFTAARLAVGDANFTNAGIGCIYSDVGIMFSLVGHSLFAGTEILGENIGTGDGLATDFKTKNPWISNVTVKVDGSVVSSGLTIATNEPNSNDISALMNDLVTLVNTHGISPNSNEYWSTGSAYTQPYGGISIFENPYYATRPIYSITFAIPTYGTGYLACSDDMETWTTLATASGTISIPEAHRGKRYWKAVIDNGAGSYGDIGLHSIMTTGIDENKIKFSAAPGLVTNEAVGTGNASEVAFALDHTPISGSLVVKLDGVETSAYTLDGSTITFTSAPASGVAITASYRYSCSITADYTTGVLAKDSNYVIDFAFSIYFAEGDFE